MMRVPAVPRMSPVFLYLLAPSLVRESFISDSSFLNFYSFLLDSVIASSILLIIFET